MLRVIFGEIFDDVNSFSVCAIALLSKLKILTYYAVVIMNNNFDQQCLLAMAAKNRKKSSFVLFCQLD